MEFLLDDQPLELKTPPAPEVPRGVVAIRAARAKLNAPPRTPSVWPVIAAAALAAFTALLLATAIIIGLPKFS